MENKFIIADIVRVSRNICHRIIFCGLLLSISEVILLAQIQPVQSRFDELLQTIRTGNAYQRAETIPVFAHIEDSRVVPILIELLEDEDGRVRADAAQQLSLLADSRSTDALAKILNDKKGNVRRYASEGLVKIGSERHVPELVASVMNYLPDPNTSDSESWYSVFALEAIGKLSSKAPLQLVELLGRISDEKSIKDEDWWRLLANVAKCLGQIADKSAYPQLQKARESLEKGYQDYTTWYAVRKALASIEPETMQFDSPAADILVSVKVFKVNSDDIRQQWVLPLSALGEKAVNDLDMVLRFESEWDKERSFVAIESLGEMGGKSAAKVLRRYIRYIRRKSDFSEKGRRRDAYLFRKALVAILKADPNEITASEIISDAQAMDSFEWENLLYDISGTVTQKVPEEIKTVVYENVLFSSNQSISRERYKANAALLLGQMGGQRAGESLSKVLLELPTTETLHTAAVALGTIKDYDPIPTFIKAANMPRVTVAPIAEAICRRNDRRALSALETMSLRSNLNIQDRLWLAAAFAHLGRDYQTNAAIIRNALPESLPQAAWLTDSQTIDSICSLITTDGEFIGTAVQTLEQINTSESLKKGLSALADLVDIESPCERHKLVQICSHAARLANKLHDAQTEKYYTDIIGVAQAVQDWFIMTQQMRLESQRRTNYNSVKQYPELTRKLWIAEATSRLDLATKPDAEEWRFVIDNRALRGIEEIFTAELVPVFERIAEENRLNVGFHGKYRLVDFYIVRSMAAKILTEKTGTSYSFIDVDGRRHPGGWDPSQEK